MKFNGKTLNCVESLENLEKVEKSTCQRTIMALKGKAQYDFVSGLPCAAIFFTGFYCEGPKIGR